VRSQITSIISTDEDINPETLKKLTKLTSLINETLRFISPVPGLFLREAIKDHTLGKYYIKKGTLIMLGVLENLYNPMFNYYQYLFYYSYF
jgi:cytochrome P450